MVRILSRRGERATPLPSCRFRSIMWVRVFSLVCPQFSEAKRSFIHHQAEADARPEAVPATFHSVRAPSVVPGPACDRDHSRSAPTTRQSLLQTTGQNAALLARAEKQSVGPGFDAV